MGRFAGMRAAVCTGRRNRSSVNFTGQNGGGQQRVWTPNPGRQLLWARRRVAEATSGLADDRVRSGHEKGRPREGRPERASCCLECQRTERMRHPGDSRQTGAERSHSSGAARHEKCRSRGPAVGAHCECVTILTHPAGIQHAPRITDEARYFAALMMRRTR